MKKMKPQELVEEINWFCRHSEIQNEDNLMQLEFEYFRMFEEYCGKVPDFEIINVKGQIKLKGYK